jgi:hypothetical protein
LLCRRAGSRYRSVYRVHGPGERYCAKVRLLGLLRRIPGSACPLAHQAALHVALWYMDRYGANWPAALGKRGAHPPAWRVRMLKNGMWAARVWEFGKPVELTGRRKPGHAGDRVDTLANVRLAAQRWKRPGKILSFVTRAEAEAAVQRWMRERWGIWWRDCVWRL